MISILIPSKNEPYLEQTIADLKENATGEIEILAREDYGIGQRALTRELAREAKYDWIMKVDAHCSFGYGFDTKMLGVIDDKTILAPYMMVLDAETWTVKPEKKTSRYCFNTKFVMLYDQENDEHNPETMCLQGSCFMVSKKNYFDWNLDDPTLGSWGGQGVELGIKAFLNGGVCKTTKETYYAHMFRHTDAEFPYDRGDNPGKHATEELIKRYKDKVMPLVEKFGHPADWSLSTASS